MAITAAAGPSAYWYLTRGTGTVALILLTLSVALGVANVRRLRGPAMPRFVVDAVHRNVSLVAMAFLAIHIVTSVLDQFAPIRLIDAIVPFASVYRPLWLGLGAVSFDLLLAVLITSLLRRRFGYHTWRLTHWAAYVSWPFAVLHGVGTGTDTKAGWMLVIVGACVVVAIVAVVARATAGWPDHAGARLSALAVSALVPVGLLVWLPNGPLAAGWAERAGTPAALVPAATTVRASTPGSKTGSSSAGSAAVATAFSAQANGTERQGSIAGGLERVDITLSLSGQQLSQLEIRLQGPPLDGGGVQMTSSEVTLGTSSNPALYGGQVTALQGTNVEARVHDSSGDVLTLVAQLQIDPQTGSAAGTVSANP